MSLQSVLDRETAGLATLAPVGFFYALHIRFAVPLFNHQTFPRGWIDLYTEEAYALRDPIIAWGFSMIGSTRWSEIGLPDPFNILGQARTYGMIHGIAVSCGPMKSRTIASAARDDRDFTDDEIAAFARRIEHLHDLTEPPTTLTEAQVEALQCVAEGDRYAEAAAKLKISESAFKARLASARQALLARTTTEAVQRARDYRLI